MIPPYASEEEQDGRVGKPTGVSQVEPQIDVLCRMLARHNPDACLEWPFRRNRDGYGEVWSEGRNDLAHRVAYREAVGPLPREAVLRHSCDNRACINPRHLTPGSHADNVADRVKRRRSAAGERNGRAKLTAQQVREIFASKEPKRHLAARYGIDPKLVRQIKSRTIWRAATSAAPSGDRP